MLLDRHGSNQLSFGGAKLDLDVLDGTSLSLGVDDLRWPTPVLSEPDLPTIRSHQPNSHVVALRPRVDPHVVEPRLAGGLLGTC